jgi:hypothetical protein
MDSITTSDMSSSDDIKNKVVIYDLDEADVDSVPEPVQKPVNPTKSRNPDNYTRIFVKPKYPDVIQSDDSSLIVKSDIIEPEDSIPPTPPASPIHSEDQDQVKKPRRFRPRKIVRNIVRRFAPKENVVHSIHIASSESSPHPSVPHYEPYNENHYTQFQKIIPMILDSFPEPCHWHASEKGCRHVIGGKGVLSVGNTILCCPAGFHSFSHKKPQTSGICTCISKSCGHPYHLPSLRVCNEFRTQGSCSRKGCLFGHRTPPKKITQLQFYLGICPELQPVLEKVSRDHGIVITTITNCRYGDRCNSASNEAHCKACIHGPSILNTIKCPLGNIPHGCCAFDCKCKGWLKENNVVYTTTKVTPVAYHTPLYSHPLPPHVISAHVC